MLKYAAADTMKNVSALLQRTSDVINKWVLLVVVTLMIAISLLLVTSVFFRYVLNNSIYWSSEVSRYLLTWLAFLGSTVAYKKGAHVGIDLISAHISAKTNKFKEIVILLAIMAIWVVILSKSITLVQLYSSERTATLNIPYSIPFSVLPITAIIWIMHIAADLMTNLTHKEKL